MFQTKETYRAAWKAADTQDPAIPLNIDIELASLCNLTCPFCFISDGSFDKQIKAPAEDGKTKRRLMPQQMAYKIIDQAAALGVPALKFNWRGESTLHPNYSQILIYAARAKRPDLEPAFHEILVNTNANCSFEAVNGLMAATKVMVSLDSLAADTYRQMRRGGDLGRVKQVIREMIGRKHPNLWVRRVISNLNQSEAFYYDVRREFGKKIHVSEHFCIDRNAIASYETVDCEHDLLPRRYCGYPSQRLVIASTGKVYPCCIDLHETMPVGDFNTQTLKEIWEGEPLKALRHNLRSTSPAQWSPTCRKCESWMSYAMPQREFVQDRELSEELPTIVGARSVPV